MFPPQSTPSKRPKRRVESYRIYKRPYSACSQSSRPSPSSYEKATHGRLVGPTLSTPRGDKYYNQYRPLCEVCPRDRDKVVGTLQGRWPDGKSNNIRKIMIGTVRLSAVCHVLALLLISRTTRKLGHASDASAIGLKSSLTGRDNLCFRKELYSYVQYTAFIKDTKSVNIDGNVSSRSGISGTAKIYQNLYIGLHVFSGIAFFDSYFEISLEIPVDIHVDVLKFIWVKVLRPSQHFFSFRDTTSLVLPVLFGR